jgi:hypothetical protein
MIRPADRQEGRPEIPPMYEFTAKEIGREKCCRQEPPVSLGEKVFCFGITVLIAMVLLAVAIAFSPKHQKMIEGWQKTHTISCPWPRS